MCFVFSSASRHVLQLSSLVGGSRHAQVIFGEGPRSRLNLLVAHSVLGSLFAAASKHLEGSGGHALLRVIRDDRPTCVSLLAMCSWFKVRRPKAAGCISAILDVARKASRCDLQWMLRSALSRDLVSCFALLCVCSVPLPLLGGIGVAVVDCVVGQVARCGGPLARHGEGWHRVALLRLCDPRFASGLAELYDATRRSPETFWQDALMT